METPAEGVRQGAQPTSAQAPFDMALSATAMIDAGGRVVGWTRNAERLLGYTAEEMLGRHSRNLLLFAGDGERTREVVERCLTHDGWGGMAAARHRDGRRIDIGLRVASLTGARGELRFLISAVDLAKVPSWAVNGAVLEAFLSRSPLGMAVFSPELRYIWLNTTLERFGGVPRMERLGRRMSEILPGMDTPALEARMRRVLETGVPVIDFEHRGWTRSEPNRTRAFSTSFFRLDDADGIPMGVCTMVLDISERWQARDRLTLLNEAGARIGSTLDVLRTAQELADFAVPRLADFVTVDLVDGVLRGEEPPRAREGHLPPFRRAGLRSVNDGSPESVAAPGEPVALATNAPAALSYFSGEPLLNARMDPEHDAWLQEDQARARKAAEYGLHSLMVAPVRARGTVLGVATFVRSAQTDPFDEDDLLLAADLVGRAAVSLDNARRYTREHAAALALQRSLLPQELMGGPAMELASRYLPADVRDGVGGDWFDVIPLSGARVALVVGDVVGHGITAAVTMGRLRTAVHTLADMELPPDELLAHLDDLVIRLTEEEVDAQGMAMAVLGATCLYAVYDPVTRRCTMARAGHPPPAIVDPGGAVGFPDLPAGPPLGLGTLPFESAELELPEGSLIALYTDGLIETGDQDIDAGLDRLGRVLAQPALPLEELCSTVLDTMLTSPPADDVALLLARTHALSPDLVVAWELRADPSVVAGARTLALRQLTDWGLEDLRTTTELIVSELVTNAVRHGTGPIRLRLIRHDVLICEVSDASSTSPRLRHARTTDEGGRGLFLVAQLSRRWGTRYTERGKLIWAEQDLPASA